MSATRDKQWQINEEIPWKDKQTALAGQVQGANNMFNAGINTLGSGIMGLAGNLMSRNAGNNSGVANGSIEQVPVMGARQLPTGNMFNNNPYSLNFTPMNGVPLPSWMNTGAQPYGMMSSNGGGSGGDIGWNNGLPQTF